MSAEDLARDAGLTIEQAEWLLEGFREIEELEQQWNADGEQK